MRWVDREQSEGIQYPGIYICAITDEDLSSKGFSWITNIVYVGMTNSVKGLKGRLKQFDHTIKGKSGHGGADHVRFEHQDYQQLVSNLFVAVASFECDVKSNSPQDLRIMGDVAKFEYDCFAHFTELFKQLPEFNDQKKSPKCSLTFGRR